MRTSSGYDQSGDAYDKGAGGGGGAVNSVTGNLVDNTDPANPVVNDVVIPDTYFVCDETGDDLNSGTSAAAPWKTLTPLATLLSMNIGVDVFVHFLSSATYALTNADLGDGRVFFVDHAASTIGLDNTTYNGFQLSVVGANTSLSIVNQVSPLYSVVCDVESVTFVNNNYTLTYNFINANTITFDGVANFDGSMDLIARKNIFFNSSSLFTGALKISVDGNLGVAGNFTTNNNVSISAKTLTIDSGSFQPNGGIFEIDVGAVYRGPVPLISAPSVSDTTVIRVNIGGQSAQPWASTPWGVFGANAGVSLLVEGYLDDSWYKGDASGANPSGDISLRYSYSRGFAVKQSKGLTGFNEPGSCVVLYDEANLNGSIVASPAGLFRGLRIFDPVSTPLNLPAHTAADGLYFYTYDGSAFQVSTTPFTFDQFLVMIAAQINGVRFGLRECHGLEDYHAHKGFHDTIGTYKLSAGGDFSGYVDGSNLAAEIKPDISSFTIWDEDLPTVINALNGDVEGYTTVRLLNAGDLSFTPAYETPIPVVENLVDNRPYWNEFTGGAWQQTLFGSGQYGKVFVMALPTTQDAHSQQFRLVFIQPQIVSGNLTTIRNVQPSQYNYGALTSLLPEAVIVGSIIYQYQPSGTPLLRLRIIECTKIFGNRIAQFGIAGSQGLTSVSVDLETISGDGTLGDPIKLLAPAPYSSPFGATTGTVVISPNVFSVFTNALDATITFQLAGTVLAGRANEYHIRFTTGAVVTAITFDPAVTWNSAPVFAPSTTYEVSIVDGFGVWVEYV